MEDGEEGYVANSGGCEAGDVVAFFTLLEAFGRAFMPISFVHPALPVSFYQAMTEE